MTQINSTKEVEALRERLKHSMVEVESFKDKWQSSASELEAMLERLQKVHLLRHPTVNLIAVWSEMSPLGLG